MNKKNIIGIILLPFAVTWYFTSCSVKEDRSACPCMLMLDLNGVSTVDMHSTDINITSPVGFEFGTSIPASLYGEVYAVPVPRTGVYLDASYGSDGCFCPGKGFVIAAGRSFPPLYLYSSYINTAFETVTERVLMHKEHCNINIKMKAAEVPYPFSVLVEGDICGVGIDGIPVEGPFSFAPEIRGDGSCSVRVPRQTSSSLILEIADENGVLRSFSIGEYIIESGYDWTAENLEDVDIVIDYAKTEIAFSVNGWEKTVHFDVEI